MTACNNSIYLYKKGPFWYSDTGRLRLLEGGQIVMGHRSFYPQGVSRAYYKVKMYYNDKSFMYILVNFK